MMFIGHHAQVEYGMDHTAPALKRYARAYINRDAPARVKPAHEWVSLFESPPYARDEHHRIEINSALQRLYLASGLRRPTIVWFDSPWAALHFIRETTNCNNAEHMEKLKVEVAARFPSRSFVDTGGVTRFAMNVLAELQNSFNGPVADAEIEEFESFDEEAHETFDGVNSEFDGINASMIERQLVAHPGLFALTALIVADLAFEYDLRPASTAIRLLKTACMNGLGIWWGFPDRVYATPMPQINFEEQEMQRFMHRPSDIRRRLHNLRGPSVHYPSQDAHIHDNSLWHLHGIPVNRKIVLHPETLTPEEIFAERNIERRRIMIERFTFERLVMTMEPADARTRAEVKRLTDLQADRVRRAKRDTTAAIGWQATNVAIAELRFNRLWLRDNSSFGKLWEINFRDDEPLKFVQVRNSTPERDGTFKFYYLKVPPEMATARQAVAWTFGLQADEYIPSKQT